MDGAALIANLRVDLTPLITHQVSLDHIQEGYRIFVLKVVVKP